MLHYREKEENMKQVTFNGLIVLSVIFCLTMGTALSSQTKSSRQIARVNPEQSNARVKAGGALLVCSYEDDRCKKILLEGAILRSELESRLPSLPKTQEIIFYCQ